MASARLRWDLVFPRIGGYVMTLRARSAIALTGGVAVVAAFAASLPGQKSRPGLLTPSLVHVAHAAEPPAIAEPEAPAVVPAKAPTERADKRLVRSWRAPLAGG